ncbi:hypothetical protein QTJ16_003737 [Diplocarpon rosae]|uniref:DNA-directed DNA polymerase n=1 Tax=Diplocarpon rosae TaxID=946125 RepID=A0AAD9SZV0_9HELO|nr:hypothetical protein QTJ16_003737 [Diplocarpon rosae]
MDKGEYFRQLYSLNDSSDDEEDTNDAQDFLRQLKPPKSIPLPSPAEKPRAFSRKRSQPSSIMVPAIHRTISAPVTSDRTSRVLALPVRKSSLLCHDISRKDIVASSSGNPDLADQSAIVVVKNTSTPNIGSVVMEPSKALKAVLQKKPIEKKRKRAVSQKAPKTPKARNTPAKVLLPGTGTLRPWKLAPEGQRGLEKMVMYYIPPDVKVPARGMRIENALRLGATWTQEWTAEITHVVVEKAPIYNYRYVMNHLSKILRSDTFPRGIALVCDPFLSDCLGQNCILEDLSPKKYGVPGDPTRHIEVSKLVATSSHCSDTSLQLKSARPQKVFENMVQSQCQYSIRNRPSVDQSRPTAPVSLIPKYAAEAEFRETLEHVPPITRNVGKQGDNLDEFIDMARRLDHLPLDDEDEEGDSWSTYRDDPADSGGEEEQPRTKKPKEKISKYGKKELFHQGNFSCMDGGTGITSEDNPNRKTIEILGEMGAYYERIRDHWRTIAYRKAVGTLKKLSFKASSYEDAIQLPWVGHRLALKIEEIAITGHLQRLDNALLDPSDKVLQLFLNIYGCGPGQADKWIRAGCKTLDDLRALPNLHKNQKIGIEHYDDFTTRIPRDEVTALGDIVKKASREIDPLVEAIIGGSYRRGAPNSGDIDFIITKRGTHSSLDLLPFLNKLVDHLTRDGFLVCSLAVPRQSGTKWHGACRLPDNPIWRRIDFLVVPQTEFGAALLYFTGDDIFNRSMRLLASKKGLRLNQRGLYADIMRGPGREKLNEGYLVEGADERAIFDVLGVPWRPPQERICH